MNQAVTGIELPELPAAEEVRRSPGASLAARRAERSMSLQDVAQRLKYSVRQIEALEQDDYPRLPGTTFVRGMIRNYAKLLDTDAAPLLRELERRNIPAQVSVDLRAKRVPFLDGSKSKRATRVYAALSVLVVAAAAAVIVEWQFGDLMSWPGAAKPGESQSGAPASGAVPLQQDAAIRVPEVKSQAQSEMKPIEGRAQAPATASPSPPTPAAAAALVGTPLADTGSHKGRIVLKFDQESWVQIKQADGRTLLSQLNRAGTEQEIGGSPPFDIVIGNASSVRLQYNGQPVDLRPHFKVDVARLKLE